MCCIKLTHETVKVLIIMLGQFLLSFSTAAFLCVLAVDWSTAPATLSESNDNFRMEECAAHTSMYKHEYCGQYAHSHRGNSDNRSRDF